MLHVAWNKLSGPVTHEKEFENQICVVEISEKISHFCVINCIKSLFFHFLQHLTKCNLDFFTVYIERRLG